MCLWNWHSDKVEHSYHDSDYSSPMAFSVILKHREKNLKIFNSMANNQSLHISNLKGATDGGVLRFLLLNFRPSIVHRSMFDVFRIGWSWCSGLLLVQIFGYIQRRRMVAYHIQFANHWWHVIIIIIVIGSAACWSAIKIVVLLMDKNKNWNSKTHKMKQKERNYYRFNCIQFITRL